MSIDDINGDHRADLAVGIPYEALGRASRAGDVLVLRASASGLTTTGAARYSQDTTGTTGSAENNDVFGSQVRLADFNRDGRADLAVSAPYEDRGNCTLWQHFHRQWHVTVPAPSGPAAVRCSVTRSSKVGATFKNLRADTEAGPRRVLNAPIRAGGRDRGR
ncbi:hypothetical protein BJ965_007643 [Streptomyces luteogriseus]|uniref:VCBS repeat-containing protein n=1 Tax=Streptomyces luteogriseus TaxID=68233 RepID=A0A7W7DW44_9ACTN|nr:FG-GAP and VCBS repeat-containing protein [Streptomyces luteogriseus]MBB4717761.1 hypothetical protein [Streptomyces luteogriseus]